MLGTNKVLLVNSNMDPKDILTNFFRLGNSSLYTARKRADQIFGTAGANRRALSSTAVELYNKTEAAEVLTDVSASFVKQMCELVSRYTSFFKRKCAVGFFMANGTATRFPEEFKLNVKTDELVRNQENEQLNNLISKFREDIEARVHKTVTNLNEYITDNFPKEVQNALLSEYQEYFGSTHTGDIYRKIRKLYKEAGKTWPAKEEEEFRKILIEYRTIIKEAKRPGDDYISTYLGLDKQSYLREARSALEPLIASAPTSVIKKLVNGEYNAF